ncbi:MULTISPECIES: TetR/AcrR family transcriptional regulator [unclassified Mycobacterium]|uniref:TetR/AcrR family transcriptional regulator n=1 Tax=unclassified Mycobacterium TaxID=2642494 RepID=UPI00074019DE|nr:MULTISPECIES: TetR/AcrR family transcriptional regulator [unclassified Mycobacterium]KUH85874.1 TetR family transcriptional regulator [Mycobacterium sp. GA-1999]KUH91732.1 TetR family transcriptional regulator [Mycobacterium sp. GA-0227b]KUH96552.1 TetR family transcriptional regulator [Mycobacterium sp. IS-1556]
MAGSPAPRRPPSGNQERAERTRRAVIDETVRYILDEGFAAPSVRRITGRAGLTWGVVQYHFGDLGGLLMAVVDQGLAELTDALEGLREQTVSLPTDRRTELVVDAMWQAFSSPTSMAALEVLISTRAARDSKVNARLSDTMRQFTELGRHLGEDLDAPQAMEIGNLIWATLRGIVLAQMVSPQPLDTSRDRRALIDVLNTYIRARGAHRDVRS